MPNLNGMYSIVDKKEGIGDRHSIQILSIANSCVNY